MDNIILDDLCPSPLEAKEHEVKVWRSRTPDLRYDSSALAQVVFPTYKEVAKGKVWRRMKKKSELKKNGGVSSKIGDQPTPQHREKKKPQNDRAQKIQRQAQGDNSLGKYASSGSVEIMQCILENSLEEPRDHIFFMEDIKDNSSWQSRKLLEYFGGLQDGDI